MAKVEVKIEVCPHCNGTEFIHAKQTGYAQLTSCESEWLGCSLYHIICRDCGTVVMSYVDDTEKLVKRKNRRG